MQRYRSRPVHYTQINLTEFRPGAPALPPATIRPSRVDTQRRPDTPGPIPDTRAPPATNQRKSSLSVALAIPPAVKSYGRQPVPSRRGKLREGQFNKLANSSEPHRPASVISFVIYASRNVLPRHQPGSFTAPHLSARINHIGRSLTRRQKVSTTPTSPFGRQVEPTSALPALPALAGGAGGARASCPLIASCERSWLPHPACRSPGRSLEALGAQVPRPWSTTTRLIRTDPRHAGVSLEPGNRQERQHVRPTQGFSGQLFRR